MLGLGDRHAQNIMVSNEGHIIHIDYGYILENPIHSNIARPFCLSFAKLAQVWLWQSLSAWNS